MSILLTEAQLNKATKTVSTTTNNSLTIDNPVNLEKEKK